MASSHPIIAVVDDDAAVRNSLKFSLEIDGFVVRTYANAEELLGVERSETTSNVLSSIRICPA